MLKKLAFALSALGSPFITLPLFSLLIVWTFRTSLAQFWQVGALFVLFVAIFPLFFIYLGVRKGRYSDIHIAVREQRAEPFIFSTISVACLTIVLYYLSAPAVMTAIALTLVVNGVIYLIISQYWKISVHTSSLAGGITNLALLVNISYFFLLFLLPILIWARIYRGRHSLVQGITGAVTASLGNFAILKLVGVI